MTCPKHTSSLPIIIGLAILGYGYMNYSAKMSVLESEKKSKQDELLKESTKELKLKECLSEANNKAKDNWNKQCKNFGVNHKKDDCTLPTHNAEWVDEYKKNEQEKCYKLYK